MDVHRKRSNLNYSYHFYTILYVLITCYFRTPPLLLPRPLLRWPSMNRYRSSNQPLSPSKTKRKLQSCPHYPENPAWFLCLKKVLSASSLPFFVGKPSCIVNQQLFKSVFLANSNSKCKCCNMSLPKKNLANSRRNVQFLSLVKYAHTFCGKT